MLLINNFPSFKINQGITLDQYKYFTGGNIGHSWISDVIRTILPIKEGISNVYYDELIMHYKNSHIVINAQDWIKPCMDYNETHNFCKKLKKFILEKKLPVILLGVGINNLNDKTKLTEFKKDINPELIELLSVISHNANLISARGEYTAEFLNLVGIQNVLVTGCPTLLIKKELKIKTKKANNVDKYNFAINCGSINNYNNNSSYFVQDEDFLLKLFLEKKFDRNIAKAYKNMSKDWYDQLLEAIRQRKVFLMPNFFSAIRKYKEYDFTLGSRLHGGIASLVAGTPTIVTNPDIRAKETTKAMGIPYFPELCDWKKPYFGDSHNILEIFDKISWSEVEEKHKKYRSNFIYFFKENNINIKYNFLYDIKNKTRSYEKIFKL